MSVAPKQSVLDNNLSRIDGQLDTLVDGTKTTLSVAKQMNDELRDQNKTLLETDTQMDRAKTQVERANDAVERVKMTCYTTSAWTIVCILIVAIIYVIIFL